MTLDSSRYSYAFLKTRRREGYPCFYLNSGTLPHDRAEWSIAVTGYLGESVGFAMPTND